MSLNVTAFLRKQLARVERFARSDGWQLQREIEKIPSRNCNGDDESVSVEVFFPLTDEFDSKPNKRSERTKVANACAGCPVADECLAGALLRGERYGGWGGVAQPDFQELSRIWRRSHSSYPVYPAAIDRGMCRATRHGTYSAYAQGCRCDDAQEANRLHKRAQRLGVA